MGPVQVEIESKFVEITQNNLKELSFDWLVGQSNIPDSGSVFVGGGTAGTSPAISSGDFPFVAPGDNPIGTFPVTSGLRSGNLAISQNAIDALLFGIAGNSALSPATAAISGVFTDPQFLSLLRFWEERRGDAVLPEWDDALPARFPPDLAPYLLAASHEASGDGVYLYVGIASVNRFGRDPTGQRVGKTLSGPIEIDSQLG